MHPQFQRASKANDMDSQHHLSLWHVVFSLIYWYALPESVPNHIASLVWSYKGSFNKININVKQCTLNRHLDPNGKFHVLDLHINICHLCSQLYILCETLCVHCKVWLLTLIVFSKYICIRINKGERQHPIIRFLYLGAGQKLSVVQTDFKSLLGFRNKLSVVYDSFMGMYGI